MKKTTVLGAGSWGTALAFQLARSGSDVFLWDHREERAKNMQERRENYQYLPKIPFPENIFVTSDLELAIKDTQLVVAVTPSQTIRDLIQEASLYGLEVHESKTKILWNEAGRGTKMRSIYLGLQEWSLLSGLWEI